jgi:hypothetical protein
MLVENFKSYNIDSILDEVEYHTFASSESRLTKSSQLVTLSHTSLFNETILHDDFVDNLV